MVTHKDGGLWLCPFCKQEKEKQMNNGKRDQSCGCARYTLISNTNMMHGDSKTNSEYYGFWLVWRNMKSRCYNPKHHHYKWYGGKGVSVYEKWRYDYLAFKRWMLSLKHGWTKGLTIDRIDNNGNYEPGNCRFVTRAVNSRKQPRFKLSMAEAREIRKKWASGNYTRKQLSIEYKVCRTNIICIINNKIWKENIV